ncbi:HGH1 [Bugula neritina]|uniref:HGH1 n=1 Tax=Bugula neritina TaxID=10212 RepID=A0A7J7KGV1_BUGNE|nr:HGH1 [Bugula neritina]
MAELHFLAPFLANLSQVTSARKYFMDKQRCVIQRLLPFMKHKSDVRRQGVSMILKNCCFDYEYHDWLLGPEVDILPCLLLPLAGPEEFDEDDMEKLPADLQYLEPDKRREPLAIVRANLVEALIQLCATANGRNFLRQSNTYIIIREYHKSEDKVMNHPMINNLVDILIGDEPSPTLSSNLKELEVPQDLQEQFSNYSKEELKALSTGTIAE